MEQSRQLRYSQSRFLCLPQMLDTHYLGILGTAATSSTGPGLGARTTLHSVCGCNALEREMVRKV